MSIEFYSTHGQWGFLSNFYRSRIQLDGRNWQTTEHYFQAMKFENDPDLVEKVRRAPSPTAAAAIGRDRTLPCRKDWEDVKETVMKNALMAKFTQHPELCEKLLATGTATLIEHTSNDYYWADGGTGAGKNRLGHLLMDVRNTLRKS